MTTRRREDERGQVLIIVAGGMVVIIAMVALVIDGGFAWAKQRDTQNAADAVAEAGATVLMQNLAGVSPPKTDADVVTATTQVATDNETTVRSAYYTNIGGDMLTCAGTVTTDSTAAAEVGGCAIPSGAAGVLATAEQEFNTFLAGVIGFTELTAAAPATAVTGYLGSTCEATAGCVILPVTFPTIQMDCDGSNSVVYPPPATFWPNPSAVMVVPLCGGSSPGNVGWIDWTPTAGGASELADAITTPSNPAMTWPAWYYITQTGGPDSIEPEMRTWDGQVVRIPEFDGTCDATPTGPGLSDCPVGQSPATGNGWYHIAAMTSFELCSSTIPECAAAGYDYGSYIQGSNGSTCLTGNGATDCLVGRFLTTSFAGEVTAAPGPNPSGQDVGVQLID
ncbi:MAG: pilus assembly protein TadG-related protein [Candidatus Limnocylindria bacterium]